MSDSTIRLVLTVLRRSDKVANLGDGRGPEWRRTQRPSPRSD
ncbi:MAG: hypothetical protein WBB51_03365 [Candidatus Microthrix parvicella]|nr:hypothetical protein [Candidatus Microthrix sp.]